MSLSPALFSLNDPMSFALFHDSSDTLTPVQNIVQEDSGYMEGLFQFLLTVWP